MSSNECSDDLRIDLDEGLTTTREDIDVLRRLRACAASWFELPVDDLEALLPAEALARRPAARADRPPFTLD